MKLRQALEGATVADLKVIAQAHQVAVLAPLLKDALVSALHRHLSYRQNINNVVAKLTAAETEALYSLLVEGGRLPARIFEREYGYIRRDVAYYGYDRIGKDAEPSTRLYFYGLVFRAPGPPGTWGEESIAVPDEIIAFLPTIAKRPFANILAPAPDPPQRLPLAPQLVRDIGVLLCYLQRENARAVRGDQLSKRDILRLNSLMSQPNDLSAVRDEQDAWWIAFVHHVAALLGLVIVQNGLIAPSDKAAEWLRQPYTRQTADVWRAFLRDGSWSEISRSVSEGYAAYLSSPTIVVEARSKICDALKLVPLQTWVTISSFLSAMKTHQFGFVRSSGSPAGSYWGQSAAYGKWSEVEARLIFHTLTHTLFWLGIVELGWRNDSDLPIMFRLSDVGCALLGLSTEKLPEPVRAPIVIQPTYEVVVPAEASPHVVFRLQEIAELTKSDRASLYALTQRATWRFLQQGNNIEDIITFLEKVSQRPLPQNVAFSLREWAGKHGEVSIETATLLTTTSEALLKELRANRKIKLAVQKEIAPTAVTLRDDDVTALVEQMKKAGYWPKMGRGTAVEERSSVGGQTIVVKVNDLVHLLAGATVLDHIHRRYEWQSPVSSALINRLAWHLSPLLLKQVGRMASEAIARYTTQVGQGDDIADDDDFDDETDDEAT